MQEEVQAAQEFLAKCRLVDLEALRELHRHYQDRALVELMKVEDPYSREAGSIVARIQGANDFIAEIEATREYSASVMVADSYMKEDQEDQPG
jgi:hypothetical protein